MSRAGSGWYTSPHCLHCLLLLSLVGCASVAPPSDSELSTTQRATALQALGQFQVEGGLGIWTDTNAITAKLNWQQNNRDFNLHLTAPLGLASLSLQRRSTGSQLQRGSTDPVYDQSAGRLLQRALGLAAPIPVEQISAWLRGLPGAAESAKYNGKGLLKSLQYTDGSGVRWRATILRYTTFQALEVPALIIAQGGPYNVRLVLKSWRQGTFDTREPAAVQKPAAIPEQPEVDPLGPGRLAIPGR